VLTNKMGAPHSLLLVIPNTLSDEIEELDNENEYADNEIPAISGKNLKTETLNLAGNLTYDGRRRTDSEVFSLITAQMTLNNTNFLAITYRLDASGDIKTIELPKIYKQANERTYNAYEKTFSDGRTNPVVPLAYGAFGLDNKTLAICVPDNASVSLDDYLAKVEMNNGQDYSIEAYDFNEETRCPDLVLIHAPMTYNSAGIIDSKSKVALVGKISNVLNDEDEVRTRIQLVTESGERDTFISKDTNSSVDFGSLKAGDLIRYSLDSQDMLDGFELLVGTAPIPDPLYSNRDPSKVLFVGNISNVSYDEVSYGLNKWVHLVSIEDNSGNLEEYHIVRKSGPPIFVYDTNKQISRLGTADDLLLTHQRAVIYASGITRGITNVKAVVIVK